jgi:hypothetical protein
MTDNGQKIEVGKVRRCAGAQLLIEKFTSSQVLNFAPSVYREGK